VRQLGAGGMGTVYEAIDQRVSCAVALKQTLLGTNAEAREAFRREAALLANLRHASLPKVMDYFGEGNGEFLVMEYIAGHDLAALLDLRGQVTEATTSNVFFVQRGVLVTPPLSLGMLEGVTRAVAIEAARREGILVREEPHGAEALAAADEVFVTSTIREVMAVTSLVLLERGAPEIRVVADGKPGTTTRRLHAAFRRYVERTHLR